jgi:membrane-associated protease RseP (regulator of RpoE activity)
MNGLLFWLILILVFWVAWSLGARSAAVRAAVRTEPEPAISMDTLADWESRLAPMIVITGRKAAGLVARFEGRLRGASGDMFRRIREVFAGEPVTPMLLEGEGDQVQVLVLPESPREAAAPEQPKWWLHWLLFVATLATTTWAGALHAGVNLFTQPERITVGLPYSLALLLILGAHELGHYFTARAHGIRVTPPYFIPVPFALGTFGAFIRIKSLPLSRRALFDVAVAGPLAGLVFAIPALFIGLHYSAVIPQTASPDLLQGGVNLGSSVLLACLAKLSLGASALEGHRLLLHPLAFAGWLGLIVTALNLLPIGQLDGGHMSHALFGSRKAYGISTAALAGLFLLALFVWPGLMFWAFIVFFIAGTHDSPAANDVTPVGPQRRALGYLTFLLLALIIVPVPHSLYEAISVHCPYL